MSTPDSTDPTGLDLSKISDAAAWDGVASGYTEVISDHLALYAHDAIKLSGLGPGQRVLDVATGPGTLARRAARVTPVDAMDFSAKMLEELRRRATAEELENLSLRQGDGQALPYGDASFDVAFSMFAHFIFPDRAKGFSELARILRPGGRAVIGTWQAQDEIAAFKIVTSALLEAAGVLSAMPQPLSTPEDIQAEMSAAGFDVEIHAREHTWRTGSLAELWDGLKRSHVLLVLAQKEMPEEAYETLLAGIYRRLEEELGTGAQAFSLPAWIAVAQLRADRAGIARSKGLAPGLF